MKAEKFPFVGAREIADRLGVQQTTVWQWRRRDLLPEPEGEISGFPAWRWETIEKWAKETGRL